MLAAMWSCQWEAQVVLSCHMFACSCLLGIACVLHMHAGVCTGCVLPQLQPLLESTLPPHSSHKTSQLRCR